MPPKRAKLKENVAEDKMEVDEDEKSTFAEKDEDGASKRKRGKAPPRVKPHEAFVMAIDVGRTSAQKTVPSEQQTDLDRSLQIADWVISRKVGSGCS